MNIYAGNLPFSMGDNELRALFEEHGEVQSAKLIMDRETSQPRGFGFVEMPDAAGQTAIGALNGHSIDGRDLTVNEAKPREDRGGGGGRR